jgi:hypothetical protein
LTSYRFSDTSLAKGNNFYRIKIVFADGQYIYSPLLNLFYNPALVINGIFPNPVSTGATLFINTNSNCSYLELYDVLGRLIRSKPAQGMQNSMYMVNLSKGVYFIAVYTDEGRITRKILVN